MRVERGGKGKNTTVFLGDSDVIDVVYNRYKVCTIHGDVIIPEEFSQIEIPQKYQEDCFGERRILFFTVLEKMRMLTVAKNAINTMLEVIKEDEKKDEED